MKCQKCGTNDLESRNFCRTCGASLGSTDADPRPVDLLVSWPASEYECSFEPTAEDRYLHELASEYHERTETYDRTVCTGPIVHNAIRPAHPWEFAQINKHALRVKKELQDRAYRERGIGRELVTRAIQKHRAS